MLLAACQANNKLIAANNQTISRNNPKQSRISQLIIMTKKVVNGIKLIRKYQVNWDINSIILIILLLKLSEVYYKFYTFYRY